MKIQHILLTLLVITCISCKKETIDFTYSPAQPKAGEKVTFVNSSSTGEEWLWRFGDRKVSTSKSPTHTYDAPGTYQVLLMVDNKESQTCTHMITVVDSIPTFVSDHDSLPIHVFEDVVFSAQLFNPNRDSLVCVWTAEPSIAELVQANTQGNNGKWNVYFTQPGQVTITMSITFNGITTTEQRTYTVEDKPATAVLMMNEAGTMSRQRVFVNPARAEEILPLTYAEGQSILAATQDTLQTVNGYTFRLSELKAILPEMTGFRIANGKIYYRTTDGLYISDVMGNNINIIDPRPISAIYTDTYTGINRLYWATATGVYYMPLVDHPQNQFDTNKIELLNEQSDIIRLAVDTTKRLR